MRPRTLLILAIVVIALAAFVRFYERDLPSSDERAERQKHLLEIKKDQITRIRLTSAGQTVVLESSGHAPAAKPVSLPDGMVAPVGVDWRITSPAAFASAHADAASVDRFLDSLVTLQKTRTLEKAKPADVGLDKPRAEISLSLAGDKQETVVKIGSAVPTGGETIVAVGGGQDAYVVGDAIMADVQKKAGDWRDRQLFHGDRDLIQRLSWSVGGGPRVVLAKRGDNFWLESPLTDRADRDQVEKLLSDVTGLSAERFLDPPTPPASQLGLDPPSTVVEAVLAGQPQAFRIELGGSRPAPPTPPAQPGAPETAPGTITNGRLGGQLFETRSPIAATLGKPAADWRSPLLSGLQVHQIDAATIRDAHGPVALSRAGTDWKRGAVTVSYMPVSDLLFSLTEAKADRLLSASEAQALGISASPLVTVELKGGQAGNETLTIFPPLTGATHGVPARTSGRDTVMLLPEAKLKEITDRLAALRSAPPLAADKPAKK